MREDLKVIRGCVVAALVIIALAGSVAAASVLAPTAIAVVLALVLAPVARGMERCCFPAGVAAVLAVGVTVSCLVAAGTAMAPAANSWIASAPRMMQSMERKLRPLKRQIAAVDRMSQRITQVTPGAAAAPAAAASEPILVSAARVAPEIAAKIIYVTILTIFLLAWRHRYMVQLILLPKRFENRLRMARICRDVRLRVSSYLFTLTLINTGLVFVTAGAFYAAGIPDPVLWGVAFGLCNFIPVIGPTAVILGAALVGFAAADTIAGALAPPLILLAINTVEANLVQPWLLSRRIVISPLAIFLIAAILVWMWGAPAAIAAVPLLIFVHTVSLHVPTLRPVALLLATESGKPESSRRPRLRVRLRRSDVHRASLAES
jgi:predicted PurR-regulated permease PerM